MHPDDVQTTGLGMDTECGAVREAASAQLDGEVGEVGRDVVHAHVAGCVACREHVAAITTVDLGMQMAPAMPVPDLTAAIVARADLERTTQQARQRRWVVGFAGVAMALLAVPALLGIDLVHAQREVAMIEVAVGVAIVAAAWRPDRIAAGVFPVVAMMSLLLVATATVDIASGTTTVLAELAHLPPLVATALLWPWAAPTWRGSSVRSAEAA